MKENPKMGMLSGIVLFTFLLFLFICVCMHVYVIRVCVCVACVSGVCMWSMHVSDAYE